MTFTSVRLFVDGRWIEIVADKIILRKWYNPMRYIKGQMTIKHIKKVNAVSIAPELPC